MKKLNYQTKFIIYHTILLLLVVFTIVTIFLKIVIVELKKGEFQEFQIITQKTCSQIDSLFYDMDRTALQIAANPDIVNMFRPLPKDEKNYFTQHPIERADVKKRLETYNFKNKSYSRICLYNDYNDFVCISNKAIDIAGIKNFFGSEPFKNVQKFFSKKSNYVMHREPTFDVFSVNRLEKEKYFSVIREIKDYYSESNTCGYVEVQESTEKIDKILDGFGNDIFVRIINNNNKIIYEIPLKSQFDFKEEYKISIPLENAPFVIEFYKNPSKFNKYITDFYILIVVSLCIVVFLCILLENILVTYMSKPLIKLNNSLKSITMDNLHIQLVEENSLDIVKNLETSFNSMLQKLNDSMKNQMIAKVNEIKSQFLALQSQMNPHFLHNMLAIISMEAEIDGNEKIPNICKKLGEILRYNSQMGNGYSTIIEECKIAEDYLLLMKVRYEDLFIYNINIQEEIKDICIPKFLIQPICENCFKHGFKNIEPTWKININIWKEEKHWFIEIKDNGSGFTKEYIEEFEKSKLININDINLFLEKVSIGGLCLLNIYARMKIIYDNDFIFELYNAENGATVLIGGKL